MAVIIKKSLFSAFLSFFQYSSTDEESTKFSNFKSFLETVDERNEAEEEAGGSATHGVTRFADMTTAEFKANFLGFDLGGKDLSEVVSTAKDGDFYYLMGSSSRGSSEDAETATAVDWTGTYAGSIKDQGYCGSCWAFSAASQIESDAIRASQITVLDTLSQQQIISCDTIDSGCYGGVPIYAYYYVYKTGGLSLNETYPYTSYYMQPSKCLDSTVEFKVRLFLFVDNWLGSHRVDVVFDYYVRSVLCCVVQVTVTDYYLLSSEEAMEKHVLTTGPLSACVDASTWTSYTSGVMSVCGHNVDHCVQIVGVDTDEGYWLIRNSWGTSWGINGYIKLSLVRV